MAVFYGAFEMSPSALGMTTGTGMTRVGTGHWLWVGGGGASKC